MKNPAGWNFEPSFGFGNQSTGEPTCHQDAEDSCRNETHLVGTRDNGSRHQADEKPDDN
jgi:hypothetical protein